MTYAQSSLTLSTMKTPSPPHQYYTLSPLAVSMSGVEWYEVSSRFVWVKLCGHEKPVRVARSKVPRLAAFHVGDVARAAIRA